MIQECLNHVTGCLKSIGINSILEDEDKINNFKGFKYAAIVVGDETLVKDGSLVAKIDKLGEMKRIYRRRIYTRDVPILVLIVDKNKELVDGHLQAFLTAIGSGIKDADENYIFITASNPNWLEERSKLKQRSGVEISLTFGGGIYKDTEKQLIDLFAAMQIETELGGV